MSKKMYCEKGKYMQRLGFTRAHNRYINRPSCLPQTELTEQLLDHLQISS